MKNFKFIFYFILISEVLCGCSDKEITAEEIINYYDINKQNSINQLSSILSGGSELKSGGEDFFKIVHISDVHVTSWSSNNRTPTPGNLLEAVWFANDPEININVIVDTGDHIGNKTETTKEDALNFLNVFASTLYNNNKIPTFTCTGNHDANMMNADFSKYALSKTDIYNHLTSRTNYKIQTTGIENYYYADVSNQQGGFIRIIAMDVIDQEGTEYDAQHYAVISQKQIDWLCEIALKENMTDKHSVIVLFHYPLPANNDNLKEFENEFLYNWRSIPEIIEAFRCKKRITYMFKNKKKGIEDLYIDASFENAPGEFICYLGGHAHTFMNYEIEGFEGLEPTLPKQIMILANNMSPSEKSKKSPIERHREGLRNNTFNIYAIDTKTKKIHITFFGATAFYIPEVITLKYK